MTRIFVGPSVTAIFCFAASAQSPDASRFEAADIHASAPSSNIRDSFMQGPFVGGGRFEIRKATIVDLIRLGWNVQPDKIVGGPSWTGLDRFDILAKAPKGATTADQRLMLQNLLADRFDLKVHKDTKPMPAFAMVVAPGKKVHLKESEGQGETGCKGQNSASGEGTGRLMMSNAEGVVTTLSILPGNLIQFNCRNMSMPAFAAAMQGITGANVGPNPVSDETGLKGAWDFDLKFSFNLNGPLMMMNGAAVERISFADALEKQLGLKLEKRQVPMPVTVIDSVNQTPTPNPAGMTLNLPALPTEFEVAEIKPTAPDFRFGNFRPQRGGRVNIEGMPLRFLIQQAWNLYNRDAIVGAPKFVDSDRYDIIAKAPTYGPDPDGTPAGPVEGPRFQTIDQDSINVMLRNLLIERFQIKYHFEERPSTAFVLTAAKPKMKKADPANRTGYHEGPGPDGKDPRIANPAASRLVTCENMTMKQLAQNLPMIAGGYVQGATVYDETGLEGAFDFTLNFSMAGMASRPVGGGRGGGEGIAGGGPGIPDASEPSGGITLSEAVEKQLGIKLEQTKRPAQVLVIDHIEPKPTEN
jgi:uncharacterized protein (TIGR03435 family)